MPGFNSTTGETSVSVMYADNASFDGTERGGILSANGELWIGSASSPQVKKGNITSTSLNVDYSDPDITIETIGGGQPVEAFLTDVNGPVLANGSGEISIIGRSGSKTNGSGSILTVKSPPYADSTAATLTVNSGTFATAAGAYFLPASPEDGDLVEIICITTGIVVTANTGQTITLAGDSSTVAGTATNTFAGDSISLRFRNTDSTWYSVGSPAGVWVLA